MLMCAYPGLSYTDVMNMTYRDRNIFVEAYNRFNKS